MADLKSSLDNYLILNTISRQKLGKLKKVQCISSGLIYSAKIFKDTNPLIDVRNEINIIQRLAGSNIIEIYQIVFSGIYTKKSKVQYSCVYILMENLANGDMFKALNLLEFPKPEICKYIFNEILKVVESVHSSGFVYGGLKLEQFFIDSNFHIKLADFSTVQPINTKFKSMSFQSRYAPPEAFSTQCYSGQAADIFSVGVILFVLCTLHFPFYSSRPLDMLYIQLRNNPKTFWDIHTKQCRGQKVDDRFKILIETLLSLDPNNRPNLSDIKLNESMNDIGNGYEEFRNMICKRVQDSNEKNKIKGLWANRLRNADGLIA